MKQVQSAFKETLFDWDCEPALERRSRFESEFERVVPPRRGSGPWRGLVVTMIVAVAAGSFCLALLAPVLASLV